MSSVSQSSKEVSRTASHPLELALASTVSSDSHVHPSGLGGVAGSSVHTIGPGKMKGWDPPRGGGAGQVGTAGDHSRVRAPGEDGLKDPEGSDPPCQASRVIFRWSVVHRAQVAVKLADIRFPEGSRDVAVPSVVWVQGQSYIRVLCSITALVGRWGKQVCEHVWVGVGWGWEPSRSP